MLVTIARFTSPLEAHILRGRLEAEEIPAYVYHEHHIGMYWLISQALGGVKVWVHPRDVEKTKEIIEAIRKGEYEIPDEVALSCPRCQSQRIVPNRISWTIAFLFCNLFYLPIPFASPKHECRDCHHIWKPKIERDYSYSAVFLASLVLLAIMMTIFLIPYCRPNYDGSSIFPISHGCGLN
jgi:hypothetical protein